MKLTGFKIAKRRFRLPSRSEEIWHIVELLEDDSLLCDCVAGSFSRPCWHKKEVQKKLDKEIEELKELSKNSL